jgi:hypothetical protein
MENADRIDDKIKFPMKGTEKIPSKMLMYYRVVNYNIDDGLQTCYETKE